MAWRPLLSPPKLVSSPQIAIRTDAGHAEAALDAIERLLMRLH